MKPLKIADYLDHFGRAPGESAPVRREGSPFRPRGVPKPQSTAPLALPVFDRNIEVSEPSKPQGSEQRRRTPWDRKPVAPDPSVRDSHAATQTSQLEDMALKLAEAHARGRIEGLAEAEVRRAAEVAAAREQALTERLEKLQDENTEIEATIRSGLAQVEANIGAAVVRILTPFLAEQVVKRAADELCRNIARLLAGGSPDLITIRGPERILAPVRERLADLPANIEYVEDSGVEAIVEANSTRIATELRPWAELLASLDA
jgi:hypothetical protein